MTTEEKTAGMAEGRITEEGLAKLRSLIGTRLRITQQYNGLASREAIRNFALGIGDTNPLWLEPEYARGTRYGRIVAPPNWYYSVFPTWVSVGLAGVHGFHAGSDWQFLKPLYEGDTVIPECIYRGYKEKPASQFAGRTVISYYESNFRNQKDELLAKCLSWSVRAERSAARKTGKYSTIELPHPWKEEEMNKVDEAVMAESPGEPPHATGKTPR